MKKGIICGLTNTTADFETECETFSIDEDALETTENKIRQDIFDFIKEHFITLQTTKENYKWLYYKVATPKYKTVAQTHGLSFKEFNNDGGIVGLSFATIIAVLFCFMSVKESWQVLLWIFALLSAIIFFTYSLFKLFYGKQKVLLKTTSEGLYYNDQLYYWSDINDFCLMNRSTEKHQDIKVVIGTICNGIVAINLKKIDIKEAEIIEILNLNIAQHYNILGKKRGAMIVSE